MYFSSPSGTGPVVPDGNENDAMVHGARLDGQPLAGPPPQSVDLGGLQHPLPKVAFDDGLEIKIYRPSCREGVEQVD